MAAIKYNYLEQGTEILIKPIYRPFNALFLHVGRIVASICFMRLCAILSITLLITGFMHLILCDYPVDNLIYACGYVDNSTSGCG